jgi:hypothetical protein
VLELLSLTLDQSLALDELLHEDVRRLSSSLLLPQDDELEAPPHGLPVVTVSV